MNTDTSNRVFATIGENVDTNYFFQVMNKMCQDKNQSEKLQNKPLFILSKC